MIDYEQTVQKIINSIANFSFEFDIEIVKKEMELQEVSKDELEKLGENKGSIYAGMSHHDPGVNLTGTGGYLRRKEGAT